MKRADFLMCILPLCRETNTFLSYILVLVKIAAGAQVVPRESTLREIDELVTAQSVFTPLSAHTSLTFIMTPFSNRLDRSHEKQPVLCIIYLKSDFTYVQLSYVISWIVINTFIYTYIIHARILTSTKRDSNKRIV